MKTLNIPRWLAIGMALCIAWCVILAVDLIPQLRGDFGWRWPYAVPDWPRLLPAMISVAIYIVVANRLQRAWAIRCWSFAGAAIIPVACLSLLGDPFYLLVTRTLSGLANGTHLAGTQITDLGQTLRNWPQIMETYLQPGAHFMLSGHIALSPPALPVFYYLLNNIAAAVPAISNPLGMALRPLQCQNFGIMDYSNAQLSTAWFGALMPVWAGLTVFPLYRAGGKLAAIWWPLIPSLAMFTPMWNTFYPLLAILGYLAFNKALREWETRRTRAIVLVLIAGILTSLATFANISIVPFIAFLDLYVFFFLLQKYLSKTVSLRQMLTSGIVIGLIFSLGVLSIWLLYYAVSGIDPISMLMSILSRHLPQDRPYLPWIYLHLYDLALFTGLPVVFVALARIFVAARHMLRRDSKTDGPKLDPLLTSSPSPNSERDAPLGSNIDLANNLSSNPKGRGEVNSLFDPLALALGAALLIMALSGTARGETGRVWLFFVPFILILAARQLSRSSQAAALTVTLVQAFTLLTVVAFLRVVDTELLPPPSAPPSTQAVVTSELASQVRFADSFSLIGQHATATKDGIDLTLSWEGEQQAIYPYYLSALVVAPNGQSLPPNIVWQPFDNNYPITCWRHGQIITETRHLPLGANPVPGDYWVSLSAFSLVNGAPKGVTVTSPNLPPDTQFGLGPIHLP